MKKIVIYVVAFNPIKILISWAHQNDCQNLSFVKAINVVGEKRPEILVKRLCHFRFRSVFNTSNSLQILKRLLPDSRAHIANLLTLLSLLSVF
jgi:hypothetical protein